MREGYLLMRRGWWVWRGRHRVNTGLLLSHLHRARGVLWGVIILGLLSTALICALLLRALAGLPS